MGATRPLAYRLFFGRWCALLLLVGIIAGCRPAANQPAPAQPAPIAVETVERSAAPTEQATNTVAAPSAIPTPVVTEVVAEPAMASPTTPSGPEATSAVGPAAGSTDTPTPAAEATEVAEAMLSAPTPLSASAPPVAEAPPADAAVIAAGLEVYKQQYCGICHQLAVANTRGAFGPAQDEMGTIALERLQDPRYHGSATSPAEYIRESIVDPNAYLVEGFGQSRHHMPAFTHLTEAELEALVQLLLAQQ